MNNVHIFINGSEVDFSDDKNFPVKLYRSVADYREPASRKGELSYTIKFPLTDRNRAVFGNLQLPEKSGKFQSTVVSRCVIVSESTEIVDGKFIITSVSDSEIEGYIVAQVGSIAVLLKDKSLRQIQSLEPIEFEGFNTIISNTDELYSANEDNTRWSFDKCMCFPIVCFGKFFVPNVWTSANLTQFLPSSEFIPDSAQSFTDITLPPGRDILGIQSFYLDWASQPHFDYFDLPPAFFIALILKSIFADAGYTLIGKWIQQRDVQKLVMPYSSDRDPIYNWTRLGRVVGRSKQDNINPEFNQSVFAKYNGFSPESPPSNKLRVRAYDVRFDKFFAFDKVLYPTGSGTAKFDQYFVLYNILHYRFITEDLAFSTYTTHTTAGDGLPSYTSFTAPTAGLYTFDVSFYLNENTDFGTPQDAIKRARTPRSFGATKYNGEIPDNLCGGRTLDPLSISENVLEFINLTDRPAPETITRTFTVQLERGDGVVFWIGMACFYSEFDNFTDIDFPSLGYGPPNDVFATNNRDPSKCDTLTVETIASVLDFRVRASVANLPETVETDRFGELLQPAQNLPDVSQLDFIKSFISLFNLYLYVDDQNRTVSMESADDFFLPDDTAYPITEKTNRTTFVQSPPDLGRTYQFVWKND
mgnify:CR=1 FL=1